MINIEQDSDGTTFQLWKQDQASSCGVASTWMARGIVRQMSFAEEEFALAWRVYNTAVGQALAASGTPPTGPMTFNQKAFPRSEGQRSFGSTVANVGFSCPQLTAALRAEGLNVNPVYTASGAPILVAPHLIGERRAGIAFVRWDGRGAHFIVAARPSSAGRIVFLDPWDGRINEQENNGRYVARYGGNASVACVLYLS